LLFCLRQAYDNSGELLDMSVSTVPGRSVAWLAQSLNGSGIRTDFLRALQDVCRACGAKHGSFLMRHVPGVVGDDPYQVDTFGDVWRTHVEEHKYASVDPIKSFSERAIQPVDWRDLPRAKTRDRRFFRDFTEFQLGRQALTATFRGPSGDRSLVTLTSDVTERRWPTVKTEMVAALGVLHPALHHAVLRLRFQISDVIIIRLTPREKQCLGWAAHGHTSKQIGENLGLTPATVNFFIDAAVSKLEASNRAHAAAKAVALGLIAPPR
jgi:DNA-binding CsgD family transcriptional regulator